MTKLIYQKLTILSLILATGLVPALSYAHENGNENDQNDHNDKQTQVENSGGACLRAFGHLFARGWIKTHGGIKVFGHCFRSFNHRKFNGMASSTPDIIPPVVSDVTHLVGTSTISVSWHTNEKATSRVYYDTSSSLDVNATSTNFVENATLQMNHSINLSGLTASTTYYMAVESKDASNNRTVSTIFTATTQ